MSHWSAQASAAANASMSAAPAGAAVIDCEDRSWEPLADIEDLPDWEPMAEIHEGSAPAPASPAGPPATADADSAAAAAPA